MAGNALHLFAHPDGLAQRLLGFDAGSHVDKRGGVFRHAPGLACQCNAFGMHPDVATANMPQAVVCGLQAVYFARLHLAQLAREKFTQRTLVFGVKQLKKVLSAQVVRRCVAQHLFKPIRIMQTVAVPHPFQRTGIGGTHHQVHAVVLLQSVLLLALDEVGIHVDRQQRDYQADGAAHRQEDVLM